MILVIKLLQKKIVSFNLLSVMKRKTNIGKKLKAWRHKKKISLYVICKSEGNGLRPERLKIIEEKDGGTSWALLCYLHFAYTHGFRILDEIWGTDVMQKPVSLEENHTSKKDIQTFETDNENNAIVQHLVEQTEAFDQVNIYNTNL